MVIKNKDGTVYKLKHPNPIMLEQDLWSGFEIHNMNFTEDTVVNTNKDVKKVKKKIELGKEIIDSTANNEKREVVSIHSAPVQENPMPAISQLPEKTTPESVEDATIERPPSINEKLLNYKRTIANCLQADFKEHIDDLYGERSTKINYKNKFTFEAIFIDEDDLNLVFWTHLNKVTKHSIIYPRNKEKRWWKVTNVKNAPEGYFISCMPSQYHPNFD